MRRQVVPSPPLRQATNTRSSRLGSLPVTCRLSLVAFIFTFHVSLFTLPSCVAVPDPDFNSPEPGARNAAIVDAAARGDRAALADLVRMLDSDDPATRLLAISALERQTGTTLGYDHAAPSLRRQEATRRWAEWVEHSRSQNPTPTAAELPAVPRSADHAGG